MTYTNHSGGADGADMAWETLGRKYGVDTIAYSFVGHNQSGQVQRFLSVEELKEGEENAMKACSSLGRPWDRIKSNYYVKCLISRNWFQVKNSTCVYAVGQFANKSRTLVDGGTGWAVQMAIDNDKPVYLFDQKSSSWYKYAKIEKCFVKTDTPTLCEDFAGIGTRELQENGRKAIKDVYEKTFNKATQTSHLFFEEP